MTNSSNMHLMQKFINNKGVKQLHSIFVYVINIISDMSHIIDMYAYYLLAMYGNSDSLLSDSVMYHCTKF